MSIFMIITCNELPLHYSGLLLIFPYTPQWSPATLSKGAEPEG
jgi:hypothetical protein